MIFTDAQRACCHRHIAPYLPYRVAMMGPWYLVAL
jgi:hypothetical protein